MNNRQSRIKRINAAFKKAEELMNDEAKMKTIIDEIATCAAEYEMSTGAEGVRVEAIVRKRG